MGKLHHTHGKGFSRIFAHERRKMSKGFAEKIILLSEIGKGSKVLDLGCGPGLISEQILKVIGSEGLLVALDISEEMVNLASSRLKGNGNVLVMLGDATNLTELLNGRKFTTAIASDVWHQLEDRNRVVLEIRKSMENGGILCVADHLEIQEGLLGDYLSKRNKLNSLLEKELHVKVDGIGKPVATKYELEDYKNEISKNGFEILKVEEDETLADVNDMVFVLPTIISSDICEGYPNLNQEEVGETVAETFRSVFGKEENLRPIGTEVFIVARRSG